MIRKKIMENNKDYDRGTSRKFARQLKKGKNYDDDGGAFFMGKIRQTLKYKGKFWKMQKYGRKNSQNF